MATTLHNAATANGNGVVFDVLPSYAALGVEVSGTFVATLHFEGQVGDLWLPVWGAGINEGGPPVAQTTQTGAWQVKVEGLDNFRVRISNYVSGSVTVKVQESSAAGGTDAHPLKVDLLSDGVQGKLQQAQHTTSATPGTVTQITLPDWARGVRIWARTDQIRFAINEDPAAIGTVFAAGALAKPDQWEVRLLAPGTGRTLRFASTVASVVVDLDVF